jgi:MFS family permease
MKITKPFYLHAGEFWNSSLLISEAVAALICSPIFGYLLDVSGTRQGPYLAGLILLFGSMIIFTASNSILWYTVARILQGGATAMVTVAGFAIVTDAVDKRHLGQMLGYIGTAMTLGFVSGPVLGGVVYSIGGFYAAFGMAFAIIALDLVLRLAVIEKKVAERWVSSPDNGVVSRRDHDHNHQSYGSAPPMPRWPKASRKEGSLALFKLLRQPRVLIALWAVIVSAIVASAFDAVS